MNEMLSVLVLLCGVDFSETNYDKCIEKSKKCIEKEMVSTKVRNKKGPFTEVEKKVFYKCYSAGAVAEAKELKR